MRFAMVAIARPESVTSHRHHKKRHNDVHPGIFKFLGNQGKGQNQDRRHQAVDRTGGRQENADLIPRIFLGVVNMVVMRNFAGGMVVSHTLVLN